MNIPENILNTLTDEQKKKIEAAKSPKELSALAKECGIELTIDQLESVSGGIEHTFCRNDAFCHDNAPVFQPIA